MNKLLTKVAKLVLGLSLAAGVGVAVGSQSKASKVDAAVGTVGERVTSSNFSAGQKVVFATADKSAYVDAITTGSSGWLKVNTGTYASALEFTLGGSASSASLLTSSNGYINFTGTKNVSYSQSSVTPFYVTSDGVICIGSSSNELQYNSSSKGFRVYSNNSYKKSALFYVTSSAVTYSVTYNANKPNGASGDVSNMPSNTTAPAGSFTPSSTTPTLSGYSFVGWSTNSSATAADASFTVTSSGLTLYAIWQAVYSVTYNSNKPSEASGTVSNMPSNTAAPAGSFTPSSTNPTLRGYSFLGWSTNSSATAADASFTVTSSGLTLYAIWEAKSGWFETAISDIGANDEFVIVGNNGNNYAMTNDNGDSTAPAATSVAVTGDEITSTVANNLKWTLTGNSSDGYTFHPHGSSSTWLYCSDANNGVRVGTDTNKTFTIDNGYLKHAGTSRYVGIYTSSDWRCYTTINNNIKNQTFKYYVHIGASSVSYTVTDSITNGTLSESSVSQGDTLTATITPSSGYRVPTSVTVTDGTNPVSFTYSNGLVTVENVQSNLVISGACVAIPSPVHAGDLADPYTVEDAFNAIDLNTGLTDVYVAGIVSEIVENWSSQYSNISFNISDDGLTISAQLEAWRCVSSTEHTISSNDDILVGAEVVVFGTLKLYNSKYEFDQGCKVVSYVAPNSLQITYAVGQHGVHDGSTQKVFTVAASGAYTVLSPEDVGISAASGYAFTGWSDGTNSYSPDDEYTLGSSDVTFTAQWDVYVDPTTYFTKVTSTSDITDGKYAIVYSNLMFDGSLSELDAVGNTKELTLSNILTSYFTISSGKVKSASGLYIGETSDSNGLLTSDSVEYENTVSIDADENLVIESSGGAFLRYNSASNQIRFRYYKSSSYTGQKAIQLYKVNFDKVFEDAITCNESAGTHVFNMGLTWKDNGTGTNLSLENLYNTLSTANKGSLSSSTTTKYDYIVGKYYVVQHLSSYNDFMGRNPSGVGGAKLLANVIGENTNTIQVVVIISLISVTAIGGYFFLRKRREQN